MRHFAFIAAITLAPAVCLGQVPAPLGQCIVGSLSAVDRQDLARWVFLSMAVHPAVRPVAARGAEAAEAAEVAAQKVGALFTRTLRDACAAEARAASTPGGQPVIASAIHFFTQLGIQELMAPKDVLAAHSAFTKFADREGIERAVGGR
jgi:hypothetical protein